LSLSDRLDAIVAQSQNAGPSAGKSQKTSTQADDPFKSNSFLPLALTPEQAALMLNMVPCTLKMWRQKGIGPPFARIRGRLRYMTADLERWLADQVVHPEFDRAEMMSPKRATRRAQLQRMIRYAVQFNPNHTVRKRRTAA
jgi:hypothetical protein